MSAWNEIGHMFPSDFVNRIGWIFVHSIWQITLIVLAVATLGRMLHRRSAAVRYSTYLAMLAVAAAAPLITYGLTSGANVVAVRPVEPIQTVGPMQVETAMPMSIVEGAPSAIQPIAPQQAADAMPENEPASTEAKQSSLFQRLRNASADLLEPWFGTIVVFWLVGITTFSIRPLIGWATMQRLRKQGTSACSKSIGQLAKRVANAVHVKYRVGVLESTLAQVPMVIGYFRPVVLIPVSVATNLSMPQIESILTHELAHVRRHDFVVNALQTVVETVLFYHPGIWWISYQIRVERENCCDDIAVAATGDRLEYGRALLAIEELRATAPTLALGANSSALPQRIRRLFSTDATISRYTLLPVYLAGAAVLLVGLSWSFLQAADNNDWGPESLDGLVCRIAPVDPKMSEDEIRLDSPVTEFKKPDDVTFAVEIKNRSKKPVTLIGVRHDDSSGVSGKSNSNHFAPHLFEFTFRKLASEEEQQKFKQSSRALPRTDRKFTVSSQAMVVLRASTHELQPGQSLKFLLRPTEFERAMEYELFAGNFTASVRYQTPGSEVRGMIRKLFPDKKLPESTPHEVASNQTMFSVAEDPKHPIPNLIWGPEKDGLQAALEIRTSNGRADGNAATASGVRLGSDLQAVLHVKNVGNKEITFVSETGRQGDTVHVTNSKGKEFDVPDVWYSGWPIDVRWNLKPGDIAKLRVLTPSLGGIDLPGEYKVHFTIRFNSRQKKDVDGNVIYPAAGDWQSELDTGKAPLVIRRDPLIISKQGEIRGRLVDDATGEPIRGATIACGALPH